MIVAAADAAAYLSEYLTKKTMEDWSAMRARVMVYSLLLLAIFMTTPAPAFAANIEHGKILLEQHCTRCHDTRVYTRPDRRIGSLETLKNQVKRCELSQSLKCRVGPGNFTPSPSQIRT